MPWVSNVPETSARELLKNELLATPCTLAAIRRTISAPALRERHPQAPPLTGELCVGRVPDFRLTAPPTLSQQHDHHTQARRGHGSNKQNADPATRIRQHRQSRLLDDRDEGDRESTR